MNYKEFKQLYEDILNRSHQSAPYDNEAYYNYVELNLSRMKRWDRKGSLDAELIDSLKQVSQPMHWIIIAEPWCGDVAHSLPFLIKMAEQNELISYEIQLRDSEPFLINDYLTNGGKSIPKLIARDWDGRDLFTWGPRPEEAQQIMDEMKALNENFENINVAIQRWYNNDKGRSLGLEMAELLNVSVDSPLRI